MQLSVTRSKDVTIVRVKEAKLTYPVLPSFFGEVQQIVEAGARKLVIDLEAVSYIESVSIGCLIDIYRLLEYRGGTVKLSGLQPRVGTMLSMTGVNKVLEIHREVSDALDAFGASRGPGEGRCRAPNWLGRS